MNLDLTKIHDGTLEEIDGKKDIKGWYNSKDNVLHYWDANTNMEHEEVASYWMDDDFAVEWMVTEGWVRFDSGNDQRCAIVLTWEYEVINNFLKNYYPYAKDVYIQYGSFCRNFKKEELLNGLPNSLLERKIPVLAID